VDSVEENPMPNVPIELWVESIPSWRGKSCPAVEESSFPRPTSFFSRSDRVFSRSILIITHLSGIGRRKSDAERTDRAVGREHPIRARKILPLTFSVDR
jgi:hypothetical protein